MPSNLLIGYPDIPFAAAAITSNLVAETGFDLKNLVGGPRPMEFRANAKTSDSAYFNFDLGASLTKQANLLWLARAKSLQQQGVTGVVLRQCAQAYNVPSTITGLKAWWDATRGITMDGSNLVSQWNDLSGNGYHLTATSTARPTWTAASSGVNSNPYLDFDGSANIMRADTLATFFAGSDKPMTVFAVYQLDTTAAVQNIVSFAKEASGVGYCLYRACDATPRKIVVRDDSPGTVKQPSYGNSTTALEVASIVNTGTAGTWYVNGSLVGSASQDIDVTAKNHTTFAVGGHRVSGASGAFVNGKICEVIIYDTALSDPDRQLVEAYLTAKWVTAPLYSDVAFSSAALTGPRQEDYRGSFSLSTATRHYWLQLHTSSTGSRYQFSKCYICNAFDMTRDPLPAQEGGALRTGVVLRSSRSRELSGRFSIEWQGVPHATRSSFFSLISRWRDVNPIVLSDTGNLLYSGAKTLHCWIRGARIAPTSQPEGTVRLDLEEAI